MSEKPRIIIPEDNPQRSKIFVHKMKVAGYKILQHTRPDQRFARTCQAHQTAYIKP